MQLLTSLFLHVSHSMFASFCEFTYVYSDARHLHLHPSPLAIPPSPAYQSLSQ